MIQNFVSKLSPQEKKIFYVTVVFVLIAIFDRLFLGPVMSKLKSIDEDIAKEKRSIRSDLHFLSYEDKILKENEELSRYYISEIKTEEEIIADFLKKLEMLATEADINLIKVSPADVQVKNGYVEYYAVLESDGKLEDIIKFMYAVDTSDDLLKVVKINMTPKRATPDEVRLSMTAVKILVDSTPVESAKRVIMSGESGDTNLEGDLEADSVAAEAEVSGLLTKDDMRGKKSNSGPTADAKGELSERFTMKGSREAKEEQAEQPTETYEIKPSPFERLISGDRVKALFSREEKKKE